MLDVLGFLLAAAQAAAPAAPPSAPTIQQTFDSATQDAADGNCTGAVSKFATIEHRLRPGSVAEAALKVRKGGCLIQLGRTSEGEAMVQFGLPALQAAGTTFAPDIATAWNTLGDLARNRGNRADAVALYKKSLAILSGDDRLLTLARLAKATAFDGGPEPLAYADEALRILAANPKSNKDVVASFHTLHARILLNQGKAEAAYSELKSALSLSGGLTLKATHDEVALRGDLATAAMLVGRKDDARLYLAYTGAGRLAKSPFLSAVYMDPPACGEETGLRPEDFAVVDFSIADDGSVQSASTVYSRGNAHVADAFEQAVRRWYWRPEDIQSVPGWYRSQTRIELRCTNNAASMPGLYQPMQDRYMHWASGYIRGLPEGANPVDLIAAIRQASSAQNDPMTRIAALGWLAWFDPTTPERRVAMADEALALVAKSPVPKDVSTWLRLARQRAAAWPGDWVTSAQARAMLEFADMSDIADDAITVDTLRLAATRGRGTEAARNQVLLLQVAQDTRLAEHHPLRQFAWLSLANAASAARDREKAQQYFANTGLSEEQCALLGIRPALRGTTVRNDYPDEAMRMGFEGWVRTEFDVAADGHTANIRTIIAYPPQVFTEAATGMSKQFRFESSYRPTDGVACSANVQGIKFTLGT